MPSSGPLLLYIETSTDLCSVALSIGSRLIDEKISRESRAHARVIAPMTLEILKDSGYTIDNCDAVVVSGGPGSYTGLRVGVSLAKGLCYGSGKPLISVESVELLANIAFKVLLPQYPGTTAIIPAMDARRMEIYTATYSSNMEMISPVKALVVDNRSFTEILDKGIALFCGDGALKLMEVIDHPNARFISLEALSNGMIDIALRKFQAGEFEDTAMYEPLYLKDFIAGVTKRGPLNFEK